MGIFPFNSISVYSCMALKDCAFHGICPFYLSCQLYCCKVVYINLYTLNFYYNWMIFLLAFLVIVNLCFLSIFPDHTDFMCLLIVLNFSRKKFFSFTDFLYCFIIFYFRFLFFMIIFLLLTFSSICFF